MKYLPQVSLLSVALIGLTCLNSTAFADATLTANDTGSLRSYNTAGNWSDSQAPHSGEAYLVSGYTLYGPGTTGTNIFAGDSLTISGNGYLVSNATNANTLQVNNLTLNGGNLANYGGAATFSGNITLVGGSNAFRVTSGKGNVTISANITGSGGVTISGDQASGIPTLYITNSNSYSGGTTLSNYVPVVASSDGAFGSGFVRVLGGTLTLQSGATNNYIGAAATLFISSTLASGSISLNYTGTDFIGALSFDNGTSFAATGTYGAIGSGAEYQSAIFTGTGLISVSAIPEPSSAVLIMTMLTAPLALLGTLRRKNRRVL